MRKGSVLTTIRFPLFFGFFPLLLLLSSQLGIPINPLNPGGNRVDASMSSISNSNILQNNPLQTSDPLPEDGEWVRMGGPLGGLGYDIRMDPRDPDLMYVTDANAGAHKSLDGGQTWFPINEGIDMRTGTSGDVIPVFCLTIDPNNPDTIWIGLQNLGNIYRSDDGGINWSMRNQGIESIGLTVRGITIEPGNSDVVYAAGEVHSFRWAGEETWGKQFDKTMGEVYKSLDGGISWRKIWSGDNLARYVWVDPRNVDVLYVSTGIYDRESAITDVEQNLPGGVGVLKSTDGGETWQVLDETVGLEGLYVGSLFMHPENPDILLAGAGHDYWSHAHDQGGKSFTPAGVWLTEDGGESWDKVLSDSHLISSVEYCENNPDVAYAAGVFNFYRSEDGGYSWRNIKPEGGSTWGPQGIVIGFPIDLQCDPRDPMRIFVNNYGGGNFLTEDGGKSWRSESQGYTGAMMRKIAVDVKNPALVYTGGRSGFFRSNDGGITWIGLDFPPADRTEVNALAINPENPDIVFKAPWDIWDFARSTDGGFAWEIINVRGNPELRQVLDFAFTPSDPQIVYSTLGLVDCIGNFQMCDNNRDSIFRSEDGGVSWDRITDEQLDGLHINTITIHPTDPDVVYVGTMGKGVFLSEDGGTNWLYMGLDGSYVIAIAMNPMHPEIIMAGTPNGVFRSENGGSNWVMSNAGLDPNAAVRSIYFDPVDPSRIWLSEIFSGVFLSVDGGRTWRGVNQGLTNRAVNDLAISSDGKTLYAATEGGGVYRLSTMNQSDFDALAPKPTPKPTNTPEPKPTKTQVQPEPTQKPSKTPSKVIESQPPEEQPDSSFPCLGGAVLPMIFFGVVAFTRRK